MKSPRLVIPFINNKKGSPEGALLRASRIRSGNALQDPFLRFADDRRREINITF
jgi:hypothetical protein